MYQHLSDNTETAIIQCLAERPSLTAKEVCECLARRRHATSRSSVYEKLKRLQEGGVLVKLDRGFTVDLSWASDQLMFITNLQSKYLDHATSSGLFVGPSEKRVWRFKNLRSLCDFWSHLYLTLATANVDTHFLNWNPYALFDLACGHAGAKGCRVLTALKRLGGHGFRIYEEARPLNRQLVEQSRSLRFTTACSESSYHRQQEAIINIVGDYVITVCLDERTVCVLDDLFALLNLPERAEIARRFELPTNVRLRLEHDPRKAAAHRRRFAAYFGVKL